MIIIGHPWVESSRFRKVFSLEDIQKSSANEVVLLEPLSDSHALASHCQKNNIPFAVVVNTLDEALFSNALGAKYIVTQEDDAKTIQPVAQEYLFDTRVLVLIQNEKEIEKIARAGVDGVLFIEAIC